MSRFNDSPLLALRDVAWACEQRLPARSWREPTDRRSESAELVHPNQSLVVVPHAAPFLLTASMSVGIMKAHSEALAERLERVS